ncbi:MAG TPA: hypothetical protein VJV23_04665 [Candidatus Polarisedimenticolia bacterium]|nr:hypothetical protein [Candidatus Polarisedimenticolia bacterium]
MRLIHWDAREADIRAGVLREAGYLVEAGPLRRPELQAMRAAAPAAVVIDLSRLPSQGRDVAVWLRQSRATRHVPLVFVEGEPGKVERTRALLPDALYTSWRGIRGAVKSAIARPVAEPVVPASLLAGYSGTPLPRKLGIKPGSVVALWDAPPGFDRTLGDLPEGASLRPEKAPSAGKGGRPAQADLAIWFVRSRKELDTGIRPAAARVGRDGLWIAWRKKTSGSAGDVSEPDVRAVGLKAGLVDFKICAIDATWSGLKFQTRRKR